MRNVLTAAANILRTDGWIVGSMKCGTGERCAVGALRAACGLEEHSRPDQLPSTIRSSYVRGLHALAAAINPSYRTSKMMRRIVEDIASDHGLDTTSFDDLSRDHQRSALEAYVIEYNDGKTESAQGRTAVLGRFDKAAASLASV